MAMPYLKLEPADYLNDYAVNNLTNEEFGVLMRLYFHMWQANLRLHNDDIYLSRQLNIEPARFAELKMKFQQLGLILFDPATQTLFNSRIKTKFHAAESFSKQQRDKRKKRRKSSE